MKLQNLLFTAIIWSHFLFTLNGFAQQDKAVQADSSSGKSKKDFVSKMQDFAKTWAKESSEEFASDRYEASRSRTMEDIKKAMQKAKVFLKSGIDTVGIKADIETIEMKFQIASDGVLVNKGTAQTFRNLTATSKIMEELLNKSQANRNALETYRNRLNGYRYTIDSLASQKDLFRFPSDSAALKKYLQQLVLIAYEGDPLDSLLKLGDNNIQRLVNKANIQSFKLQGGLEEIQQYNEVISKDFFKRDFDNIWENVVFSRPFGQILEQAVAKGFLALMFYLQNNIRKVLFFLLLALGCFIYLRSLKKYYVSNSLIAEDYQGQLVLRSPLCSSLLIVISIFQFIFFSPPFILNFIFWSVSAVCLTIIFRYFVTRYWINVWLLMVLLFLLSALDNLILQASRSERWVMLFLAVSGCIAGTIIILKGKKQELREKLILMAISFMAFLEFASAAANIFGRYNLAKALLISGYLNVVVAILFLWTIRIINEALFLGFNVYTRQDAKLFYLNFNKIGNKAPIGFYILLVFGWIILFGRNFAGFDYFSAPLIEFFTNERKIGDYAFSINGIMFFILILGISVIASKIVSFFASDRPHPTDEKNNNPLQGLGSWLLLIRIGIISLGFFLAVAAAGIPVDRIVIVLGALGVGIGFGLQVLVNNLVSGLIVAFEKPVNVGDIVEVDGQCGKMKSIGFRSSVISTWSGADVIMPNGDLLNAHLINWTIGGGKRRSSFSIGISYDSDLEKTREIILSVLAAQEQILQNPSPAVQYGQFGNSSIDVEVFFWTKGYREAFKAKSDLIIAITNAFRKNGIVIPFPHQNIIIDRINEKT